jgi:hypothetical protein
MDKHLVSSKLDILILDIFMLLVKLRKEVYVIYHPTKQIVSDYLLTAFKLWPR